MERSIGVIDSGVGGLTVAQELTRQLPREKLIYLGDTKRCPYGPRTKEEVMQFTWEMVRFLLKKDIKLLVIACNTATAYTINDLQEQLDIPVIGVINPGSRAAIKQTETMHVGIIGTEGTVKSGAYPAALKYINPDIEVEALACPLFVPLVEQGIISGAEIEKTVQESLRPLQGHKGMDTLILGCTHYPLLKPLIEEVMGENVSIISSSEETARETSAVLELKQLQSKRDYLPVHEFYSTGDLDVFVEISKRIFRYSRFNMLSIKSAHIEENQEA